MKIYRQGDVMIEQVACIPQGAKQVPTEESIVLAYGEVTGHAHRITPTEESPVVEWSAAGERFLSVALGTALTHEEHDAISLPKGDYRVIQQREYTPEAIRPVAD